jgi:hypothetical protein
MPELICKLGIAASVERQANSANIASNPDFFISVLVFQR